MQLIKTLCTTADAMVYLTVEDCLNHGEYVATEKDSSYELLHYQTGLSEPTARIMTNPARPLNFVVALARWVWLMAGNDRVEDIAYYEPKVAGFSDNGLTVPGSCYGARLFNSQPGIDQIAGVISRLDKEPGSRQASAVVWQPHDAVRNSNDIPCTHGMFFHVKDNRLHMAVTMRSNNAFRILPFNIFEFTMLQEYVASSLGLPLGDYVHWAASMHVYDNDREMPATRKLVKQEPIPDSIVMPPMPTDNVREQVNLLCQFEAQMRMAATPKDLEELSAKAVDTLNSYWLSLFDVLNWHANYKRGWEVSGISMPSYMYQLAHTALTKMYPNNKKEGQ